MMNRRSFLIAAGGFALLGPNAWAAPKLKTSGRDVLVGARVVSATVL